MRRTRPLEEAELRELAASIAAHGLYVPCRIDPSGVGLDGRNRVAACALVGVEPAFEVYEGDPIAFIVDVNAERRHLTTGQRAMAVAIGLVQGGMRQRGQFQRGSVPPDTSGSGSRWPKVVAEAGAVLDHVPELADPVLRGETALDTAYRHAEEVRRRKERVAALGGDLPKLVEAGVIDLAEAERRADEGARVERLADDLGRCPIAPLVASGASLGTVGGRNHERLVAPDRSRRLGRTGAIFGGLCRQRSVTLRG